MRSFGVSGLLAEDCKVFYDSLFTPRHLGRVSDLIAARLREAGADELRIRALLLFGFFEAYRAQIEVPGGKAQASGGATTDDALSEPLIVECGLDSEKMAIGVSFVAAEGALSDIEELAKRLADRKPQGPLEVLIQQIHGWGDRTVLRIQPDIRRMEIISLLGIPGKIDAASLKDKPPVELVSMEKGLETTSPKAEYIELGDLDYARLLAQDSPGANAMASPTGQILAHGCTELEDAIRVRGQQQNQGNDTFRISGVTQKIDTDTIRIAGGQAQTQDQTTIRVSGGASAMEAEYRKKIDELTRRIKELEDDFEYVDDANETDAAKPAAAKKIDFKSSGKAISGLFKKVWSFNKSEEDEEEGDSAQEQEIAATAADPNPEVVVVSEKKIPEKEEPAKSTEASASTPSQGANGSNPEAAASNLMIEIEAGSLDRTINKAQKESSEIKKDLGSTKAKRWVDGLMGELVQEKARLHEFARKLNQSIRQKEFEFRNKEVQLQEELRRRDDLVRQKNNALSRAKEQLSQMTLSMERLKSASQSAQDDGLFKQKYNLSQRILEQAKSENMALSVKMDDLKGQLANAQLSKQARGAATPEVAGLQAKCDRMQRQLEEFKRQNQQLMEKINDGKMLRTGGGKVDVDDMKKRLELAVKINVVHEKEKNQLKLRLDELQREDVRVKAELAKVYMQLKAAKAAGGGQSGTGPKAA